MTNGNLTTGGTDAAENATTQTPAASGKSVAELESELAAANARIAEMTINKAENDADEAVIAAKMQRGLSRVQALSVIKRQRQYDASSIAAERRARRPGEAASTRERRADEISRAAAKTVPK